MDQATRQRAEQSALDAINKVFRDIQIADGLFSAGPRYRYFYSENKSNKSRAKDMYFWTVQVARSDGKRGFLSGVYRYTAKNKGWRPIRVVAHKKRKDAKARALRLCRQQA